MLADMLALDEAEREERAKFLERAKSMHGDKVDPCWVLVHFLISN